MPKAAAQQEHPSYWGTWPALATYRNGDSMTFVMPSPHVVLPVRPEQSGPFVSFRPTSAKGHDSE